MPRPEAPTTVREVLDLALAHDAQAVDAIDGRTRLTWSIQVRTCADFASLAAKLPGKPSVSHPLALHSLDSGPSQADDVTRWLVTHWCRGDCPAVDDRAPAPGQEALL